MMTSEEKKYLTAFLKVNDPYMIGCEDNNGKRRYSCLSKAYRAARLISGRDMETGSLDRKSVGLSPLLWDKQESPYFLGKNSFIGVLNYLIILEMIGSIFAKGHSRNNNNIFNAIKDFSNCNELLGNRNERKIRAIIALRNALTHNYGLASPAYHSYHESFKFSLNYKKGEADPIVHLPSSGNRWEWRNFSDKDSSSNTIINSQRIGSLTETVLQNVIKDLEDDKLRLALDDGFLEFKSKYTIL